MAASDVREGLRYTKDHEWAKDEGDLLVRIGITAFAVEQLGDITLVDLPKKGATITCGKTFGTVESVKTLSDLYAPVTGEVVEVNDALSQQPELVNEGAYDKGWMVLIKVASADILSAQLAALLAPAAYRTHLEVAAH